MTKIKVNINKADPPKERIRKYKNYDNFLTTYQKLHTPRGIHEMWTKDRVKFSMIVVFIVLFLLYLFGELGDMESPLQEDKKPPQESVEKNKTSQLFYSQEVLST